jgi:hypothetical protein
MTSRNIEASEWDELQARSLALTEIDGPQERLRRRRGNVGISFRWKQIAVLVVLGMCAFMVYIKEDVIVLLMLDVETQHEIVVKDRMGDLKRKFTNAKSEFEAILEEDYGIYKDQVFTKENILNAFHTPTKLSKERLKRRIMIRILEAQLGTTNKRVDFNWVTAGHSAAAGHGNLFNQTYTYVLEQSMKPIFETLGITFFGRNYAMGNTKSAPENALCMSSLYGLELDVLSWDFGMTDGSRDGNLYNIWSQRAGVHPSKPTIISFGSKAAVGIHETIEKAGMSTFEGVFVEDRHPSFMASKFPDSDDESIKVDELPRAVKYYRCDGHTETGVPCNDYKFHTGHVCDKVTVKGQVSWHNGWKDHLFKGKVTAAFFIEAVHDALNHLDSIIGVTNNDGVEGEEEDKKEIIEPSLTKEYLEYLYGEEVNDKALFLSSELPAVSHFETDLLDHKEAFLRGNSICRYGYLPSFTRYSGYVTESPQEIKYVAAGKTTYQEEGLDHGKDQAPPTPDNDSPPILFNNYGGERQVCEYADIDSKDYFSFRNEDNWIKTILPNDSENNAFSDDDLEGLKKRQGIITLCERAFGFGKFPGNHVYIENLFHTNEPTVVINDVQATNVTKIGTNNAFCYVLHHDGEYRFPPSEEHKGRYEIKIRVPNKGGELYISSLIVI